MADIRGKSQLAGMDFTNRTYRDVRLSPDGAIFSAPWYQSLVFAGVVYHAYAGGVSTGIAGHAAADADQPEFAVLVPDGTEVMPLFCEANMESYETTLGIHELIWVASNISVGAGTSTLFTGDAGAANGQGMNMRMDKPFGSASTVRHTYSANGTDPLTAGNFIELAREAGNFDSDAATSGIKGMTCIASALNRPMPVIKDAGTLLGYGGGGTTANYYFKAVWAENAEGWLSS